MAIKKGGEGKWEKEKEMEKAGVKAKGLGTECEKIGKVVFVQAAKWDPNVSLR